MSRSGEFQGAPSTSGCAVGSVDLDDLDASVRRLPSEDVAVPRDAEDLRSFVGVGAQARSTVVWLFEGVPDRPERLRRWLLEDRLVRRLERRRVRRGKEPFSKDWAAKLGRGNRVRRRVADVVTEPGLTITAELSGGLLLALQYGRLTDPEQSGSLVVALLGAGLVAIGVFLSRSREAYLQKLRDRSEDRADVRIMQELGALIEETIEAHAGQILNEFERLRTDLDALATDLRTEIKYVRDDLDGL